MHSLYDISEPRKPKWTDQRGLTGPKSRWWLGRGLPVDLGAKAEAIDLIFAVNAVCGDVEGVLYA